MTTASLFPIVENQVVAVVGKLTPRSFRMPVVEANAALSTVNLIFILGSFKTCLNLIEVRLNSLGDEGS